MSDYKLRLINVNYLSIELNDINKGYYKIFDKHVYTDVQSMAQISGLDVFFFILNDRVLNSFMQF